MRTGLNKQCHVLTVPRGTPHIHSRERTKCCLVKISGPALARFCLCGRATNTSYTRMFNSPVFLLAAFFFGIGCGSVTHRSLSRPGILRQVRRIVPLFKSLSGPSYQRVCIHQDSYPPEPSCKRTQQQKEKEFGISMTAVEPYRTIAN